ncbi:MAG: cytidylate kinase-like family protein [Treponema sp.]|nr:cytidylate kinase-like family protein [Treponema sp.]
MAIITLTRQSGSMGDEIGMLIARRLGYTFYDRKEIERRIIKKGLSAEELKKYDERKPSFFDRFSKLRDKYLNCLSMVILEMAQQNNCVIMGRGAFLYLRDMPNHLTLRFVSTEKERLAHIKKLMNIESDKLALKMLKESDKRQYAFYKSCFHYDLNDHTLIHATINTASLNADMLSEMIVAGVSNNVTDEIEKLGEQRINELILGQQITNKLIFEHNLRIDDLWILVRDNVITLHGVTAFHATVERAITIINSEWAGYEIKEEIKCVQESLSSKA